jgi:hypothetical protein
VKQPGLWDRPPDEIPGRGETEGFAIRTRQNLDFVIAAHGSEHADVHVVTQVVLSLLGIVVFPFERHLKFLGRDWKLADLAADGWPQWSHSEDSRQPETLWDLIAHLRHAVAHSNIAFSSDSRFLDQVVITFTNKPPNRDWIWSGSIRGDDLLEFSQRFLRHVEGVVG